MQYMDVHLARDYKIVFAIDLFYRFCVIVCEYDSLAFSLPFPFLSSTLSPSLTLSLSLSCYCSRT